MQLTNHQKAASLYLSLALGCIECVKEMEEPKSARYNRLNSAIDPINRAVDMYRISTFPVEDINNAVSILELINDEVRRLYP